MTKDEKEAAQLAVTLQRARQATATASRKGRAGKHKPGHNQLVVNLRSKALRQLGLSEGHASAGSKASIKAKERNLSAARRSLQKLAMEEA